jgi:hypothetical protein
VTLCQYGLDRLAITHIPQSPCRATWHSF